MNAKVPGTFAPYNIRGMVKPPADGPDEPDVHGPRMRASIDRYWRANLRIMAILLAIWAFAGLGCGVVFADWLNQFQLGGFPLGFWFAQQGSILVFVVLILVYAVLLNRLDARHREDLERIGRESRENRESSKKVGGDEAPR